jgi:hypothetical protein
VLADRSSERWRPVYVPYAALSVVDLCSWVLSTLGEEISGSPQAALEGVANDLQREGLGLLLLVDDAAALPMETARWLGRLVAGPDGPLALVVASGDRAGSSATLAALGQCEVVRLSEPMNDGESAEYIRARLGRAGAPDSILARFDDASIRRLYAISGGNPRRLHIAASDLLHGGSGRRPRGRLRNRLRADRRDPGGRPRRGVTALTAAAPRRPASRSGASRQKEPGRGLPEPEALVERVRLEPRVCRRHLGVQTTLRCQGPVWALCRAPCGAPMGGRSFRRAEAPPW